MGHKQQRRGNNHSCGRMDEEGLSCKVIWSNLLGASHEEIKEGCDGRCGERIEQCRLHYYFIPSRSGSDKDRNWDVLPVAFLSRQAVPLVGQKDNDVQRSARNN